MSDRLSFDQKSIPHQRFSEGVFCGDGVIGAHPCHLEHSLCYAPMGDCSAAGGANVAKGIVGCLDTLISNRRPNKERSEGHVAGSLTPITIKSTGCLNPAKDGLLGAVPFTRDGGHAAVSHPLGKSVNRFVGVSFSLCHGSRRPASGAFGGQAVNQMSGLFVAGAAGGAHHREAVPGFKKADSITHASP